MLKSVASEFLGTLLLLAKVVGSAIMGESLSGGNVAIVLLANALATGAMLFVLINVFGPISGAHFNPVVTAAMAATGRLPLSNVTPYFAAQIAGGVAGVVLISHCYRSQQKSAGAQANGLRKQPQHLVCCSPFLVYCATKLRSFRKRWLSTSSVPIGSQPRRLSQIRPSPLPAVSPTPSPA
jgi:glycerol uptake facilitator-like aquaporin